MSLFLALGGPIASGKSTLASALIGCFPEARLRAFGDIVRDEAARRGRPGDRESLQRTGQELIAAGWPHFVARVVEGVSEAPIVIFEGVRHPEAFLELRAALPDARAFLIYVDPPTEELDRRALDRGEQSADRAHAVESELPAVRSLAHLVVDGIDPEADARAIVSLVDQAAGIDRAI